MAEEGEDICDVESEVEPCLWARLWKWCKRNPKFAFAIFTTLLGAAAYTVYLDSHDDNSCAEASVNAEARGPVSTIAVNAATSAVTQTMTSAEVMTGNNYVNCTFYGVTWDVPLILTNAHAEAQSQGGQPTASVPTNAETKAQVLLDTTDVLNYFVDEMTKSYLQWKFDEAIRFANLAEQTYSALVKPYDGKNVILGSNLVKRLVFLYSFLSEERLTQKKYAEALRHAEFVTYLSMRDPWPRHEALRAVIVMRKGMAETHSRVYTGPLPVCWPQDGEKRKRFDYEYWDCLASWGYYLPVKIDYKNMTYKDFVQQDFETNFPRRLNFPHRRQFITTFPDTGQRIEGDMYFERWLGFDKYEKFNLSEYVRRSIYEHFADRGMEILTPDAVGRIR